MKPLTAVSEFLAMSSCKTLMKLMQFELEGWLSH